jgi:hypothetical protein
MTNDSDHDGNEPTRRRSSPQPRDSHARPLTTTLAAARHYRTAQTHHPDKTRLLAALRRAVRADPRFAVAAADLMALDGHQPTAATPPLHAWERHHVEIVTATIDGNTPRAADLLREHLTVVACDPIATTIVLQVATHEPLTDILQRLPRCHNQRATTRRVHRP